MNSESNCFKISEKQQKGRCMVANQCQTRFDQKVLAEEPVLCYQLLENRKNIQVCEYCLKVIGTLTTQLKHVSQQNALEKLKLPLIDDEQQLLSNEVVRCDKCEELYCSVSCQQKSWEEYHQIWCGDKLELQGKQQWKQFVEHAAENQEVFYLAAKTICRLIVLIQKGSQLEAEQFKSTIDSLCWDYWWKIVAIPDDVAEDDFDNYRVMLKRTVQESLNILQQFLQSNFKQDEEQIPQILKNWLTLNGYGRLLGSFIQNGICIEYPNPLSEYLDLIVESENFEISKELEQVIQSWRMLILDDEVLDESEDIKSIIQECSESCRYFQGSGIFKQLSNINHSCEPNASVEFIDWNNKATLVATREIEKGEEICISYINCNEGEYKQRQQELLEYKFECDCQKCELDLRNLVKKRRIKK